MLDPYLRKMESKVQMKMAGSPHPSISRFLCRFGLVVVAVFGLLELSEPRIVTRPDTPGVDHGKAVIWAYIASMAYNFGIHQILLVIFGD